MAFYNIDVIALSYSKFPTRYAVQGAFLSPAGVREGEESEWIGLLIVGKAEPKNVEGGQHNQGSESREVFFRIGVAQVFKKAWDTWVEKRCKEILLI
jgi:hypothetical protein